MFSSDTPTTDNSFDVELNDIKRRLDDAIEQKPREERYVTWLYHCLMYDIQPSGKPLDDDEAKKTYRIWKKTGSFPSTIESWLAKYCEKRGFSYHFMPGFDGQRPIASFSKNQTEKIEQFYYYHKAIVDSFKLSESISLETVKNFIRNPQWPKDRPPPALTLKNVERVIKGLTLPRRISVEQAREELSHIADNDYAGLAMYGGTLGIDLKKTITAVLDFIAAAYAVPVETLKIVEVINEKKTEIRKSLNVFLNKLENNGHKKKLGLIERLGFQTRKKPRLVLFEDSPLYEIFDNAKALPDHAKNDNALYQRQIQATQLAIEVILIYDDALEAYTQALEERLAIIRGNEKPDEETLSARDVVNKALSKEWEDKLQSLKGNRQFATLHAGNLAVTLDKMTDMQLHIEAVCGLSANLALPYRQAQAAFMSYQAMQLGRVSELSNEIIKVSGIPKQLSKQQAYDILINSLETTLQVIGDLKRIDQERREIESFAIYAKRSPQ